MRPVLPPALPPWRQWLQANWWWIVILGGVIGVAVVMLRVVSRRHADRLTRKKPGRTVKDLTLKIKKKPKTPLSIAVLEDEEPEVLKD